MGTIPAVANLVLFAVLTACFLLSQELFPLEGQVLFLIPVVGAVQLVLAVLSGRRLERNPPDKAAAGPAPPDGPGLRPLMGSLWRAAALPSPRGDSPGRDILTESARWALTLKHDRPLRWIAAWVVVTGKLALLGTTVYPAPFPLWALAWIGFEAAYFFVLFRALRSSGERGSVSAAVPWQAALAGPAVNLLALWGLFKSIWAKRLYWDGLEHRLNGPGDVETRAAPSAWEPWRPWIEAGALAGSSMLLGAAYSTGPHGILAWLAYVPLFWIIEDDRPGDAFWKGWLFGAAGWSVGIGFVVPGLLEFLPMPAVILTFAFAGLCAYHGLMFGILAWLVRVLAGRGGSRDGLRPAAWMLAAPAAMAVIEAHYPMLFPEVLANTQYFHLPAVQSLDLFGAAGLTWLITGFNAAAYLALRSWRERTAEGGRVILLPLAIMTALAIVNEGYGLFRIPRVDALTAASFSAGRSSRVAVIQGDVEVPRRFDGELFRRNLNIQNRLTREAISRGPADLIVWSESSWTPCREVLFDRESGYWADPEIDGRPLAEVLAEEIPHETDVLLGAVGEVRSGPLRGRRYNLAFLKSPSHELAGSVEKIHLLPMGEFVPFGRVLPSLYKLFPRSHRLSAGDRQKLLAAKDGARIGVSICYEDLIAPHSRRYSALGADFLVNITNDAGFHHEAAMRKHMDLAALRAIENRKFLLRAVNSGISAVIDPVGRVTASLSPDERGVIVRDIARMDVPTLYGRTGRLLYHLAAAALLVLGAAAGVTSRRSKI